MAEIKRKLITPSTPSFIRIEMAPGLKQDGWKELPTVRVGDLDDSTLEEIAEEWKRDLLQKAHNQRLADQ